MPAEEAKKDYNCFGDFHGRTGRKKLGGRKEICPTFSDCARPVPKKFFPEQINFGDKFSKHNKIDYKIDRISNKIDRICPIYFYNKPILPDCEANIARLAFLPPPARYAHGDFWASRSIEPPTESSFEIYSKKILVISNTPQVLVYIYSSR